MKRLMVILTLALGVLIMIAPVALAQDGHGQEGEGGESGTGSAEAAPYRGAAVYAEFCQACHGPQGEAIADGPAFAAIEYDPETAPDVITNGLDSNADDGVAMPPYGELLSEQQVNDVLAYMATWGTGATPPLPEPNVHVEARWGEGTFGNPHAGAVIYAKSCYGCHGAQGEGRGLPDFPALETTQNAVVVTSAGTGGVYMPAFGEQNGGPLSEEDLDNLMAYLSTWESEPDETTTTPEGTNVLIIVMGVVAIIVVGGAYMSQVVSTET
jgi:mono/diheme cytochrome c family protein